MKSLVKAKAEKGIWLQDTQEPEVGHNDLLIKIRKTAICGTDMHIYNWDDWSQNTIPVPMVVGHEYVGEVVGMGQEVRGFAVGDRVSGEGHITCGHCRNCRAGRRHLCRNTEGVGVNRSGAFAEYLVIPAFNAFKIPDNILVICLGKSTYARCGIIVNVTPLEPGWEGHVTLEFSNTTPLPAKIYANEGVAQFIFLRGNEKPDVTYANRKGKYMKQKGVTLPKV